MTCSVSKSTCRCGLLSPVAAHQASPATNPSRPFVAGLPESAVDDVIWASLIDLLSMPRSKSLHIPTGIIVSLMSIVHIYDFFHIFTFTKYELD